MAPPPFACPRRAGRAHWAGGHHREAHARMPPTASSRPRPRGSPGSRAAGGVADRRRSSRSRPDGSSSSGSTTVRAGCAARRGAFGAALARTHAAGATRLRRSTRRLATVRSSSVAAPCPRPTSATWGAFYARDRVLPYLAIAEEVGNATAAEAALVRRAADVIAAGRVRRRRAARAAPRRPLARERAVVGRRRRAHRSRGARRPSRDRPRDARALRLPVPRRRARGATTGRRRFARAGATGPAAPAASARGARGRARTRLRRSRSRTPPNTVLELVRTIAGIDPAGHPFHRLHANA